MQLQKKTGKLWGRLWIQLSSESPDCKHLSPTTNRKEEVGHRKRGQTKRATGNNCNIKTTSGKRDQVKPSRAETARFLHQSSSAMTVKTHQPQVNTGDNLHWLKKKSFFSQQPIREANRYRRWRWWSFCSGQTESKCCCYLSSLQEIVPKNSLVIIFNYLNLLQLLWTRSDPVAAPVNWCWSCRSGFTERLTSTNTTRGLKEKLQGTPLQRGKQTLLTSSFDCKRERKNNDKKKRVKSLLLSSCFLLIQGAGGDDGNAQFLEQNRFQLTPPKAQIKIDWYSWEKIWASISRKCS